ncbi:uncharacterized protein BP5553_06044 [Venustampulla echinocandica]|uniref:CUE domain-containing protein n=1 Tax=Venustampulla echinocandica TaxID=2656787 RepID=A0A370TME5_9HELO|nr:uncharacterized protein BP5553_06044 [Venustampulla echinocandica]RDL36692.1 hypothetical protein BP5553_06044 [Venustampulla echinocandica]
MAKAYQMDSNKQAAPRKAMNLSSPTGTGTPCSAVKSSLRYLYKTQSKTGEHPTVACAIGTSPGSSNPVAKKASTTAEDNITKEAPVLLAPPRSRHELGGTVIAHGTYSGLFQDRLARQGNGTSESPPEPASNIKVEPENSHEISRGLGTDAMEQLAITRPEGEISGSQSGRHIGFKPKKEFETYYSYLESWSDDDDESTTTESSGVQMEEITVKVEEEFDLKAVELLNIFPKYSMESCKSIVKEAHGNLEVAFSLMEKERGNDLEEDPIENNHDGNIDPFKTHNGVKVEGEDDIYLAKPGDEASTGPRHKRKCDSAHPAEDSSPKRPRIAEEKGAMSLDPAEMWVEEFFSDGQGVTITLESVKHPCKFPKKFLMKTFGFFRDHFSVPNTETQKVSMRGVKKEIFDPIVQWAVCKHIQLDPEKYTMPSNRITGILDMVELADKLGLPGFGHGMSIDLTTILAKDRTALRGHHIRKAYTFEPSHPIQAVFVKAAVRPFLEFRDVEIGKDKSMAYGDDDAYYSNDARRIAFHGDLFQFDLQMRLFPNFELQLMRAAKDIWHSRIVETRRGGRNPIFTTFLKDPLTGERFRI